MPKNTLHLTLLILAGLGGVSVVGLVVLGFTPGETESIRSTLSNVAIAVVAAIAGLVNQRQDPPAD